MQAAFLYIFSKDAQTAADMGQRIVFERQPRIVAVSTIAGTKECEGIVGRYVETALADDMFGESTYEKAECKMLSHVIDGAISNAHLARKAACAVGGPSGEEFHCVASVFVLRKIKAPRL